MTENRIMIPGDLVTDMAVALMRQSDAVLYVATAMVDTDCGERVIQGLQEINAMTDRIAGILSATVAEYQTPYVN